MEIAMRLLLSPGKTHRGRVAPLVNFVELVSRWGIVSQSHWALLAAHGVKSSVPRAPEPTSTRARAATEVANHSLGKTTIARRPSARVTARSVRSRTCASSSSSEMIS